MILQLLAYYTWIEKHIVFYIQSMQSFFRRLLGPEPQNYYIMEDGSVIPSTMQFDETCYASAILFDVEKKRFTLYEHPNPTTGRFRPLHTIACRIENDKYMLDITDWLGELRANPVPSISPKSLILLWMHIHNKYIPLTSTKMYITNHDGTEEEIQFH